MASLYIDRLKSNFQQADHSFPRAQACENWFPRFFIRCFANAGGKECCARGQVRMNSGYRNLYALKEPKICAIGLRLDRRNETKSLFWSLLELKKLLQQYLNIIRRYRSYFCITWKPVANENCENTFSFTSFISIISKCSKKFTKTECFVDKDTATRYYEYVPETCNFESSWKNSYKLNSVNKRRKGCSDDDRSRQNMEQKTYSCFPLISSKKNDNSSLPPSFMEGSPTNCTVLTVESNDSTVFRSNNSSISKLKKNVCVQTSKRRKSYKKLNEDTENSEKENYMIPTKTSSSKDVKTIFKVNDADFHDRKSKTNLKELKARHRAEKTSSSKIERRIKRSKERAPKNSSKNVCNIPSIVSFNEESECSPFNEAFKSKRGRNVDEFHSKSRSRAQTSTTSNINSMKTSEAIIYKTRHPRNDRRYSTPDSPKVANATRRPKSYLVESKTSEIRILGNVKKRLEEDYDEYFSVVENDSENDLVGAGTPRKAFQMNRRSSASSETRISQCASKESLRTARSMLMTVAQYQESQNHVWRSALKSSGHKESETRSITASLMYNCSSCCSNLDLVRSQSSYYQSVREDECTPTSSVEYCTASSISLSKFHSSLDNSFDAVLQNYSMDTDVSYDCNFNLSPEQTLLSNDVSFEDIEIDQNAKEFLDETVVNSFTVCCCQGNSTPKFSNSSRRVTESLDSGIMTDYSRDCLRASEERMRKRKGANVEKREHSAKDADLLPTYDFDTDTSCSDDSLNRRVDVVVKKFTENLILTERKVKVKLRRLQNPARRRQERKRRKSGRQVKKIESAPKYGYTCELDSPHNDDDKFLSSSTPPVFSFSDSEMDHL